MGQSERTALPEVTITPDQCRGARAMLRLSQSDLAGLAGVSRQTVVDFEREARTPYPDNRAAIRAALEAAGVEFIDDNGDGPGVRLRKAAEP
jgi:DNA-binding XRE family transcriptional regulator